MTSKINRFAGIAATALAAALLATPALADGMRRGSLKDAPKEEPRRCTLSANVALTTEYVFRGVSQTAEEPAIQGGFDATCGMFYAGLWASNLDFGTVAGETVAHIEIDWYAGLKGTIGKISWDVGVIYYSYPGSSNLVPELDYVELKLGASASPWKDGTVGVTVFYSPDYTGETGRTWTVEGTFTQGLSKVGMFTPSISALLGYQVNEGTAAYIAAIGNGDDNYLYWNVGLTLGFLEKWSLDFRYWDTNLSSNPGGSGFCNGPILQCDERFVATLKFTF